MPRSSATCSRTQLGGTALEVRQDHNNVLIENNKFANNGVHDRRNLWSDGLTIHGLTNSQIIGNEFVDNTDIDLILGGSQNCLVQGNRIYHTGSRSGGSFAGLMIHKWPTRTADYSGTEISFNIIDGGPNRNVGSGIYVGSEGWYPGTPIGWTTDNPVRASIHDNEVRNTKSGMYVAAQGFAIFDNQFFQCARSQFPIVPRDTDKHRAHRRLADHGRHGLPRCRPGRRDSRHVPVSVLDRLHSQLGRVVTASSLRPALAGDRPRQAAHQRKKR